MSRSTHMLSVFAAPTIEPRAERAATARVPADTAPGARLIAPAAVTSSISMMRGLTSAIRSIALLRLWAFTAPPPCAARIGAGLQSRGADAASERRPV